MTTTVTPNIVNVNTKITASPAPNTLQQSGAIVSAGATTLASNTSSFCGSVSQVASLLVAPYAITSLAWASSTVTATVDAADLEGLGVGDTFATVISGAVPAGYNGTFVATVASTTTFTYAVSANPGSETSPGTFTGPESSYILDAATTFFAQGSSVGFYLLELGVAASDVAGVAALSTYLTTYTTPQAFYAYLVPPYWDDSASTQLAALALAYNGPTAQTYFFVTTTSAHLSAYAGNKAVFAIVPSPTQTTQEVQVASLFYNWIANNPGSSNPLAPMQFRFLYGVTPWVRGANNTTINAILTGFGNIALTGSEGGISNACLFKGTTMDGAQSASWFGLDWFRINVKQRLAAAIINGSNSNPPLLYDQNGINTLEAVANQVGSSAVAFGCAQSVTVSAVDFNTYVTQNPSDYAAGIYNGLTATMTLQNGFMSITVNLDAVQFASA